MALPRSQEDGRLEGPPACREDGRYLARRVHRLLRAHRGPARPHHLPESPLRQGGLLESYLTALCWHRGREPYHRWCCDAFAGFPTVRKYSLAFPRLTGLSNVVAYAGRSSSRRIGLCQPFPYWN